MTTNSVDFGRGFRGRVLEMHWAQWVALGVQGYGSKESSWLIDLEALIASTLAIGRFDRRLLERALSWCRNNRKWLNLTRLSRICDFLSTSPTNEYPAVLDAEIAREILGWFRGRFSAHLKGDIFRQRDGRSFISTPLKTDYPDFPPMKFSSPALLQINLRALFGVSANVETLIYLLIHDSGNSNAIANEIGFSQRNVYHILEDLSKTTIANRLESKAEALVALADKEKIRACLGMKSWPRYINWIKTWLLLDRIVLVFDDPRTANDAYLLSSRLRDFGTDIQNLAIQLRSADLPDFEASGSRILPSLERSLTAIMDGLARPEEGPAQNRARNGANPAKSEIP